VWGSTAIHARHALKYQYAPNTAGCTLVVPACCYLAKYPADSSSYPAHLQAPDAPVKLGLLPGGATEGFIKDGVEYRIGDVMYLHPQVGTSLP
jgi:hypothetical protein